MKDIFEKIAPSMEIDGHDDLHTAKINCRDINLSTDIELPDGLRARILQNLNTDGQTSAFHVNGIEPFHSIMIRTVIGENEDEELYSLTFHGNQSGIGLAQVDSDGSITILEQQIGFLMRPGIVDKALLRIDPANKLDSEYVARLEKKLNRIVSVRPSPWYQEVCL